MKHPIWPYQVQVQTIKRPTKSGSLVTTTFYHQTTLQLKYINHHVYYASFFSFFKCVVSTNYVILV